MLKKLILAVILSILLKYGLLVYMENENTVIAVLAVLLGIGIGTYVIFSTAHIIEETTGVLKNRTGLAGGLLQSLGTAFPDMVIGVTAAIMSLSVAATDNFAAITYAIIAASTTFGSNIFNVGYASWCLYRQNLANKKKKNLYIVFI